METSLIKGLWWCHRCVEKQFSQIRKSVAVWVKIRWKMSFSQGSRVFFCSYSICFPLLISGIFFLHLEERESVIAFPLSLSDSSINNEARSCSKAVTWYKRMLGLAKRSLPCRGEEKNEGNVSDLHLAEASLYVVPIWFRTSNFRALALSTKKVWIWWISFEKKTQKTKDNDKNVFHIFMDEIAKEKSIWNEKSLWIYFTANKSAEIKWMKRKWRRIAGTFLSSIGCQKSQNQLTLFLCSLRRKTRSKGENRNGWGKSLIKSVGEQEILSKGWKGLKSVKWKQGGFSLNGFNNLRENILHIKAEKRSSPKNWKFKF